MLDKRLMLLMILVGCLGGCGGSKVLKEVQPMYVVEPLAGASDGTVTATLDWVIVRDGPGTWAKNADWDQYLVRLRNDSIETLQIEHFMVVDSLGTRLETGSDRKELVSASRKNMKRHKDAGIEVRAGYSGVGLFATGVAAGYVGAAATVAIVEASLLGGAASVGTAGAVATGVLLIGPALAVGGIVRSVNNSKVDAAIRSRQASLPFTLDAGDEQRLNVFFPLAPSPEALEIRYRGAKGEHVLTVDLVEALDGLHLSGKPLR